MISRALIAVCVVVTARNVKVPLSGRLLGGAPAGGDAQPARKVAPFTQPADGWTTRLSGAQRAQLEVRGRRPGPFRRRREGF